MGDVGTLDILDVYSGWGVRVFVGVFMFKERERERVRVS